MTSFIAKSTPLAGHNAIEAATFTVALAAPPSPDRVDAIRSALNHFAEDLPGEQVRQGGVLLAIGGPVPPVGEAVRFMARPNGSHRWRAQLTGTLLHVACFEYTRFNEVWTKALSYLRAMLDAAGPDALAIEVSHQYVDKFLYPDGMTEDQYQVEELFQANTPYLTAKSLNSGLLWHVFQGWFESTGFDSARVLHQLNISNTELAGPSKLGCIIDHRCVLRSLGGAALQASELIANDGDGVCRLDSVMKELHARHKAVLTDLLQQAKRQEIGMGA